MIFSPDGRLLATSGNDGLIKLWDVEERTLRRTLEGHGDKVRGSPSGGTDAVSPPGGRTTTSGSGIPDSGELLRTIARPFAHRRWRRFQSGRTRLASASFDKTIKLWDAENGQEILTLRCERTGFYDVAFSPDGRWLAAAGVEGTACLWDSSPDFSAAADCTSRISRSPERP